MPCDDHLPAPRQAALECRAVNPEAVARKDRETGERYALQAAVRATAEGRFRGEFRADFKG
jgi:hypothetical protein